MHRLSLKRVFMTVLLGIIFTLVPLWAQNLEIHYINVQQGQSTLIIGPDGTTLLYDGGAETKGNTEVIPYLQGLGIDTTRSLDYVVISHRHTDHYRGVTEVLEGGYDALNIYDNGSDYDNIYVQQFLTASASTSAGSVQAMQLGQVIPLGNGARATCVAVNGSVIGVGPIPNGINNENDRSVCLLIEYGDFDFLITGDLGGGADDGSCTGRSTSQVNIESPLVQAISPSGVNPLLSVYGVEVAHVAHHGSESSCNSDYMNFLTPSVACISVGAGQSPDWFHPRRDVVENVLMAQVPCVTAPPALVLQTEEGSPAGEKTSFAGYSVGDIVVTTNGVETYTVSASGFVSQGPDERGPAGLPATFYFDEVSGGDPAPVLYNVRDENVTDTSAQIAWTSSEDTTTLLKYGTATGVYTETITDSVFKTQHTINLTNLIEGTTYYYQIEATDSGNQTTVSMEYSFKTTGGVVTELGVLFSEIYYDTVGNDSIEEWIELYNSTDATIDVGGWTITDNNGTGATFTIPSGTTIAAGTYLTIAVNSGGFNTLYGFDADVYGSIPALNNGGDTLILKDQSGNEVDAVAWEGGASSGVPTGWGSTSNPFAYTGNTIVRKEPITDTNTFEDWGYATGNGNPQTQGGVTPPPTAKVIFSEIFYDTPGNEMEEEWLELYNTGSTAVDLSGWKITDNNGTGYTYTIPNGVTMRGHSYMTIARAASGFTVLYGYDADLYANLPYLNNGGDTLILFDAAGNEVDAVAWEGGASAGTPDGWGSTSKPWAYEGNTVVRKNVNVDTDTHNDWGYANDGGEPQTQVTPGNILFSEVFYDTPGDENKEEWFELYNNSTFEVNVGGWTIVDNNGTGFTFTIPAGTTIQPGTFLTIARSSEGFVTLYGYEADVYGSLPYLNNGGDTLILKDPDGNVKDFVAWEGGAGAGIPDGWGSTSKPWASGGNTIVKIDYTVDTDTYVDWTYATDNGKPQTQAMGVPDTTPPVISAVRVDNIFIDSAVVLWSTDEAADGVVEYGLEPGVYFDSISIGDLVTEHSVNLAGLTPGTTYFYRVKSKDEAGNETVSEEYSFTTLAIMINTVSLEMYKYKNDVHADATITVTDNGLPVEGAVVSVTWTGIAPGSAEAVTDANGVATIRSDRSHPNDWTFTLTVDSIVKEGYYWDSAASMVTETIKKHPHK